MIMVIRRELTENFEAIRNAVSLVAIDNKNIVGQAFFSPVSITTQESNVLGMGLTPTAVLPEYQRRGIGFMLVQSG